MHPVILDQVARDHVRSLVHQAEAARLARAATAGRAPLRRRVGLGLIAVGERLAPERPQSVVPVHPARPARPGRV